RLPDAVRPLAALTTLLSPFVPMLFMGDEYGEPAPFQFFTDHIDEEIATATREGRRREFAAFAAFAGADVPDPQAEETFLASKLTRQADPALARLTRDLLALRRELPRGDARAHGDEEARWVRVTRGPYELCMNFADRPATVPASGGELVFSLHGLADLGDDGVALPPRSAAVLRARDAA
ncbi:MAG: maltooligosyltrehalose trehalohydrolase, partial [Solirubrobacteraceae bacterium]|nr:maltooligosyltrehalose trehalohydrolase [Solirubrobacteraceae bacterium]